MSEHHRRLLDMLSGWSTALDASADAAYERPGNRADEYAREAEHVADLYQEAGKTPDMTPEQVSDFVFYQVMDVLLRGRRVPWPCGDCGAINEAGSGWCRRCQT